MATPDVINSALATLDGMAVPASNAALAALLTQRDTLMTQLATLNAQIAAAQGADGQMAGQVAQVMRQVLANRVPGLAGTLTAAPVT